MEKQSLSVTPQAIQEVKRILAEKPQSGAGLRIGVKGGGCSGLSYTLNFDVSHEGDHIFEQEGVKVLVDPKSLLYLSGTTLDFSDSLQDRGFRFINPNASITCGCGESFSV